MKTNHIEAAELSTDEAAAFHQEGFFLRRGFASAQVCQAMWQRAVEMARADIEGTDQLPSYILRETRLDTPDRPGEERAAKIFRLHRDEEIFRNFATDPRILAILRGLIGNQVDCFLSQFIFKNSGSLGQPWHQDGFYFPFDRQPQIGLWLAITEAHESNSPLWVVPGSHREEVHTAVTDPRPDAPFGYVEIVDHDMSAAIPVFMKPGDLLVFHSQLMHRSTDHRAGEVRAAMVYHYADAATVDGTEERWGNPSPNNDWMPVLR
ncbi:MAG: phytanoyl-CoA dioxygenase family protein [Deltaproteobacteria bacterium]